MTMLATTSLGLGDYAVIGGMLAAMCAVMTTLTLANIKALGRRVEVAEDRMREFEEKKVDRVAWLQTAISSRKKMDGMSEQIVAMDSKLDAQFGIGAAINRLAASIEKRLKEGIDA